MTLYGPSRINHRHSLPTSATTAASRARLLSSGCSVPALLVVPGTLNPRWYSWHMYLHSRVQPSPFWPLPAADFVHQGKIHVLRTLPHSKSPQVLAGNVTLELLLLVELDWLSSAATRSSYAALQAVRAVFSTAHWSSNSAIFALILAHSSSHVAQRGESY